VRLGVVMMVKWLTLRWSLAKKKRMVF